MDHNSYAVAVLIESDQGIPLIRDPHKPNPVYWKFPGGRSELGETAIKAAIREIKEELGLILDEDNLKILYQEDRNFHSFILFGANISKLDNLAEQGNEGEEIRLFSIDQIKLMDDFFPNHKKVLEETNFGQKIE